MQILLNFEYQMSFSPIQMVPIGQPQKMVDSYKNAFHIIKKTFRKIQNIWFDFHFIPWFRQFGKMEF